MAAPQNWEAQLTEKGAIIFGEPGNYSILQHADADESAKTFMEDLAEMLLPI